MPSQGPGAPRPRRRILAALLLIVIAAVAVLLWRARQHRSEAAAPTQPTLIVLPLHPAGARHEEGVLAEGLSAEFAAQLQHIQGLRTIARTSALRAGTDHLDPAQLAQRVGATHVLTGELRELGGDQLHLDLQLLDAPAGRTLWSHSYEHKLGGVAVLEREVAQAVATQLHKSLPASAETAATSDPQVLRDYLEARELIDGPQRSRGIDLLREIAKKRPDFARAHGALARALTTTLRGAGGGNAAELDEAMAESAHALELDPDLADAHIAQAVLACRVGDWARGMTVFIHAVALDPADAEARITYAYWLAALGYVDEALAQAERASQSDPLSYNANFARARLLDTVGRHDDAARYLGELSSESGGLVYAKWHNAVWRHDYANAGQLIATMPRSDGFRESYTVVTEALSEPRLWPQALPLIATSERANGGINVQRIMMPNPDYGIVIAGLEKMLRDGWPSYYMLLWMPEYAPMRRDPAFQDFLKRTHLLDYWREHRFPPQCRADGDGAHCN
jgi:TolB-like protein